MRYNYRKKLVFIGGEKVGKKSFLKYLLDGVISDDPIFVHHSGVLIKLETASVIQESYFDKPPDVIFIVYDITNAESFETAKTFVNFYKSRYEAHILVGNKLDLEEQRKVSFQEAEQLTIDNNIPYIEISTKKDQNVYNALKLLLNVINYPMFKKIKRNKLMDVGCEVLYHIQRDNLQPYFRAVDNIPIIYNSKVASSSEVGSSSEVASSSEVSSSSINLLANDYLLNCMFL